MTKNILVFLCLFLIEQTFAFPLLSARQTIYLPMKKDHKYGDDICYYREIDEKLDYDVYYVKPCEQGKYCQDQSAANQNLGFCRDIPTNVTSFPSYGDTCSTNGECQSGLVCDGTCKLECSSSQTPYQHDLDDFDCKSINYKKIEKEYCKWYEPTYTTNDNTRFYDNSIEYSGTFPGFPKECGIIRFKTLSDFDTINLTPGAAQGTYKSFTRYIIESKDWSSIGEAKDGDFVVNDDGEGWRFCKSGFTLDFYPNGELSNPGDGISAYNPNKIPMCVTPTEIDDSNALAGCVITYKGKDGSEHKYRAPNSVCNDQNIVIKSQLYTEFIEEFNNADPEDKKNCYKIPLGIEGNCQNIKLLKLNYFYNNINDYLFYKDRKDLEKVLHFRIQQAYHRYYEFSTYLNLNYLFLLLFLILF